MDSISVASVKQAARQAMHVASDKLKLAEAVVGSSEYQVGWKGSEREEREAKKQAMATARDLSSFLLRF